MEASDAIPLAEPWWTNSLLVTFAFKCNLACTFCMVEDALDVYEGTTLEAFRRATSDPAALGGARRIVFSGGEVTLAKNLLDYVAHARSLPGVEHVRIQTNAVRLGNRDTLRALLDAGVDEYFVSLHAADAALCDALTQRRGSFQAILAGLRAVAESGAALITNTAVVADNHRALPAIVDLVAPLAPRSMEFWNYWPRADEDGARQKSARVTESRGPLLAALEACLRRGIPPVVKWYPRCLLGDYARFHDDGQPPSIIEDRYWDREPAYGCLYEGVCRDAPASPGGSTAGACAGLSDAYVRQHGWEEHVLRPNRGPRQAPEPPPQDFPGRSLLADAGPRRAEQAIVAAWLAPLGLEVGGRVEGWDLASATRVRDPLAPAAGHVALVFQRAGRGVAVRLHAADPARRSALRTKSFDVSYRVDRGAEPDAPALLRALVALLHDRDPGGLRPP